eukprot:gene36464-44233_t
MRSTLFSLLGLGLVALSTGQSQWYYNHWCGEGLQYLDDANCAKIFPTVYDRDWTCGAGVLQSPPAGFIADTDLPSVLPSVDTSSLFINDTDLHVCVILTKRVANSSSPSGVSLYNKYFCSGNWSLSEPFEPWSSSKIFAMANAASHMRTDETQVADGVLGMDAQTTGKHGATPLGDLATVVCSYDTTAGYSSNSLSSYFHDIGWRQRIHDYIVNDWLWKGQNKFNESLGGNYGEATPSDLSFTLTPGTTSAPAAVDKDPWPVVYPNSLSSLSEAEMVRRLALWREMGGEGGAGFPGLTWMDVQHILYGSSKSVLFPGQLWGGMTADPSIFLQSVPAVQELLSSVDSPNRASYRIFSKLGAGYS